MDITIGKYTIKDVANVVNHEIKKYPDRTTNVYTCSDETIIIATEYKDDRISININKDSTISTDSLIQIQ
jgi:hypothetical protein